MPGMRVRSGSVRSWGTAVTVHPDGFVDYWDPEFEELLTGKHPSWLDIDPDDPATAGCLLEMLGDVGPHVRVTPQGWHVMVARPRAVSPDLWASGTGATYGRACIATAEALGFWPGGEA